MALSFTAGHVTLANWGFSVGDIAVLAGAGRSIGTWIMNQVKDRALLEFMRVDQEDLIPRRGLIDPAALHQRWDVRLTMLQNGNIRVIGGTTATVIESMDIFSWLMTLITSALDATLQISDMRTVMPSFLIALFEEHVDGLDYLLRELPQHIQGWMSAGVVRGIVKEARRIWDALLQRKRRLPGQIPGEEMEEIQRFLVWLTGAKGQKNTIKFETASTDVFGLAIVLQKIGLDMIKTISTEGAESETSENNLIVIFNPKALAIGRKFIHSGIDRRNLRKGMRIPLDFREECVSLWPGAAADNNDRRQLFKDGAGAAVTLEITPIYLESEPQHFGYALTDCTTRLVGRTDPLVYRMVSSCFPLVTPALLNGMSRIMGQHPEWKEREGESSFLFLEANMDARGKAQVFIMGYFYAMLDKVLDTSRMTVQEAFGHWGWYDLHLLYMLNSILADHIRETESPSHKAGKVRYLQREGILKLLTLLFAGGEEHQWESVDDSTIGVVGKISVVSSSLLAYADTAEQAMKFCLLDIDSTAIPSSTKGIVRSGESSALVNVCVAPKDERLRNVNELGTEGLEEDFTSHIEPDWDNDVQACQVVFRYKGRIIRRLSPTAIEKALLTPLMTVDIELPCRQPDDNMAHPERAYVVYPEDFITTWPGPHFDSPDYRPDQPPILLLSKGCTKARVCVRSIYYSRGFLPVNLPNPWPSVGWTNYGSDPKSPGSMIYLVNPESSIKEGLYHTGRRIVLA